MQVLQALPLVPLSHPLQDWPPKEVSDVKNNPNPEDDVKFKTIEDTAQLSSDFTARKPPGKLDGPGNNDRGANAKPLIENAVMERLDYPQELIVADQKVRMPM
jgi:hypothetical protein